MRHTILLALPPRSGYTYLEITLLDDRVYLSDRASDSSWDIELDAQGVCELLLILEAAKRRMKP